MAANNDARVDTTFIGYLLIGFILLLIGILGLQEGELFGTENTDMPLDWNVLGQICAVVGLILILLAIFAYRTGKPTSAVIFVFFGLYLGLEYFNGQAKSGISSLTANSDWFLYVAIAIFFLIFAIYALVSKAPKFVALLLLLVALMTFFIGLCCFYGQYGAYNLDLHKAMGIVSGIFAFLGFIVATYLGLAYADPKKIPLI